MENLDGVKSASQGCDQVASEVLGQGSMRAILQSGYGSVDVLRVGEQPRPEPKEREVLIEVRAAGIDRGVWHLMTGKPYLIRLFGFGFFRPNNPVLGLDVAGKVVAVGEGVTRFKVGDSVYGIAQGSFAEFACAHEDKLALKPENLSFEEAGVSAVSGMTALQGLLDVGELKSGERVLVIGASGGVGSFAVQIAKAHGAHVTGVAGTSKLDFVRSLGADAVIDYTKEDFSAGSEQFDLILDMAGHNSLARLRKVLTPTGRVVFGGDEDGSNWTAGFERQLYAMLVGWFVPQRFSMLMNEEHHRFLDRLNQLYERRAVVPRIEHRYALNEVPQAIADMEAGRLRGKAVVNV